MSYGVWNCVTKRFCFGIAAQTRDEARTEFCEKAPETAKYRYRYEVKPIPKGWVNPKNPLWRKDGRHQRFRNAWERTAETEYWP